MKRLILATALVGILGCSETTGPSEPFRPEFRQTYQGGEGGGHGGGASGGSWTYEQCTRVFASRECAIKFGMLLVGAGIGAGTCAGVVTCGAAVWGVNEAGEAWENIPDCRPTSIWGCGGVSSSIGPTPWYNLTPEQRANQ